MRHVHCGLAVVAAALALSAGAARGALISQNLSSGTFANPGLVGGSTHATGTHIRWNYTGNFADPRYLASVSTFGGFTAFHSTIMANGNATSNTAYGPDVPAGTPAYSGVEFYYIDFGIPAGATNVSLNFSRFAADDRLQFQLNDQLIGYWGGTTTGAIGQMIGLGSQPTITNVVFNANFANPPSLTNQGLFNIGGQNVMRFWVNNTNSSSANAAAIAHSSGDPSVLDIRGVLSYELATTSPAVPEPGTAAGLVVASVMFGLRRRRGVAGSAVSG